MSSNQRTLSVTPFPRMHRHLLGLPSEIIRIYVFIVKLIVREGIDNKEKSIEKKKCRKCGQLLFFSCKHINFWPFRGHSVHPTYASPESFPLLSNVSPKCLLLWLWLQLWHKIETPLSSAKLHQFFAAKRIAPNIPVPPELCNACSQTGFPPMFGCFDLRVMLSGVQMNASFF